jgi:hypothetical protein
MGTCYISTDFGSSGASPPMHCQSTIPPSSITFGRGKDNVIAVLFDHIVRMCCLGQVPSVSTRKIVPIPSRGSLPIKEFVVRAEHKEDLSRHCSVSCSIAVESLLLKVCVVMSAVELFLVLWSELRQGEPTPGRRFRPPPLIRELRGDLKLNCPMPIDQKT